VSSTLSVTGSIVDLLLDRLPGHSPLFGLAAAALLTSMAMLLVFRRLSDQQRLAAVKRQIHADFFEIRLFNDRLSAILRAQGSLLRHHLTYLRLSLLPMLVMAAPMILFLPHLEARYGYEAGRRGDPMLITAQLRQPPTPGIGLDAPADVDVLTPAVYFPSTRQVLWRVAAAKDGHYPLKVRLGSETVEKTLEVTTAAVRVSPARVEPGTLNQLLNPSEPPLRAGGVAAVRVNYSKRTIPVFGMNLQWPVVYLAFCFVFAVLLRRPLRTTL
jgi:hypothetical protein